MVNKVAFTGHRHLKYCDVAQSLAKIYSDFPGAYSIAWPIVSLEAGKLGLPVYAPWMFGCGLAGGDWSVVRPMIEALCPEVIWVRRETGHTWEKSENYRGF